MNASIFGVLSEKAQASLAKASAALEGVSPTDENSWIIDVSGLPESPESIQLFADVKKWAGRSRLCLYYFECLNTDIDLAAVERAFVEAKSSQLKQRAFARLNSRNKFFYVGSSQSIAKRLCEHLGYGASATFALQLIHWARQLDLKLQFVCAKYPDTTPYSVVQLLEDALWEIQGPMFGRQGRK